MTDMMDMIDTVGYGWICIDKDGYDRCGWIWNEMDGYGWIWMDMDRYDRYGWIWMYMYGYAWI